MPDFYYQQYHWPLPLSVCLGWWRRSIQVMVWVQVVWIPGIPLKGLLLRCRIPNHQLKSPIYHQLIVWAQKEPPSNGFFAMQRILMLLPRKQPMENSKSFEANLQELRFPCLVLRGLTVFFTKMRSRHYKWWQCISKSTPNVPGIAFNLMLEDIFPGLRDLNI